MLLHCLGGGERKWSDVVNPGEDADKTKEQHQSLSCQVVQA